MQNHVIRIEQALRTFGGVPLTHGALLSILGESRSPNNKTARMIDEGSVGTTHANFCRIRIKEKGKKRRIVIIVTISSSILIKNLRRICDEKI